MTRRDRFAVPLFFILPFCFLGPGLTAARGFFARDLTFLFHPWRSLGAQMLQSGQLPLWNPYQMGGMPFLANCQSSILYPFTLLFSFLGFPWALKAFYVLHYALAGLGLYLLARRMRFAPGPALAGGILFAYNGYALTRLEFLSALGCLIWLPWMLIFCLELRKGLWPACALAAVLSISFLAGFPQIFLLQALAALAFSLVFQPPVRALKSWAAAGGLFLALAGLQWVPALELWSQSIRGTGVALEEAGAYSLPPGGLLGLIFPHRILHHEDRFLGEKFFWIWSSWWGLAVSCALPFAWKSGRKRLLAFSAVLGLLGVVWSAGNYWSQFAWIYRHFFPLRLFRYPPVALIWTASAVSLLLLCGLSGAARLAGGRRCVGAIPALFLLAVAAELWFYGRNALPAITHSYFYATFDGVRAIVADRPGAALLSPKVNRERRLAGMGHLEAWMRFRGCLFDLTNLPYRLRTLVPSGEPLALASFGRLRARFAAAPSFQSLRPLLNLLNVTHFMTHDEVGDGWEIVARDRGLNVYRNPQAMGEAFALGGDAKPQAPVALRAAGDKVAAEFLLEKEGLAVFQVPAFPGWKAYCAGCETHRGRAPIVMVEDFLQGVRCAPGRHRLFLAYRPASWTAALVLFLAAASGLLAFAGSHVGAALRARS